MSDASYRGRCLCGATRYRVGGPARDPCICHCESCRLAAGAPFVAWVTFDANDFGVVHGCMAEYRSSPGVVRGFCSNCGTTLTYHTEARPEELDVTLVSLESAAELEPRRHVFAQEKLPWVRI